MDRAIMEVVANISMLNRQLTELERDILSTAHEIYKQPFNRDSAIAKIVENDSKHIDVAALVRAQPSNSIQPFYECSDNQLKNCLEQQLAGLVAKEAVTK